MENAALKINSRLNFYVVDRDYLNALRDEEIKARGYSCIPMLGDVDNKKPTVFCGTVLHFGGLDYFVPVSAKREQQADNYLLHGPAGNVLGSLRFNYMFPVPVGFGLVSECSISSLEDLRHRSLLSQELQDCVAKQPEIQSRALRTYKRVLLGKVPGLAQNSCDFRFLEEKCRVCAQALRNERAQDAPSFVQGNEPAQIISLNPEPGSSPHREEDVCEEKLNFYYIDEHYVDALREAEMKARGFSCVPNLDYGEGHKQKFFCGVALRINGMSYYVPVSSNSKHQSDNCLMIGTTGNIMGSLRFNYMIPVPDLPGLVAERPISSEPDLAYRSLLSQQLRCCIKNQQDVHNMALRTYNRVLLGKDPGLMAHSCDFRLLERICENYTRPRAIVREQPVIAANAAGEHLVVHDRLAKTTEKLPLGFYSIDESYITLLRAAEIEYRGYSCVPMQGRHDNGNPKFFCGSMIRKNGLDYFVPISSKKEQQSDNYLLYGSNGAVLGSLRFNYMFPVPAGRGYITEHSLTEVQDPALRAVLMQELRFCFQHRAEIQNQALRTYDRVLSGGNPKLTKNSCAFRLLEEKCGAFVRTQAIEAALDADTPSIAHPSAARFAAPPALGKVQCSPVRVPLESDAVHTGEVAAQRKPLLYAPELAGVVSLQDRPMQTPAPDSNQPQSNSKSMNLNAWQASIAQLRAERTQQAGRAEEKSGKPRRKPSKENR